VVLRSAEPFRLVGGKQFVARAIRQHELAE
jgi:hypothetical protein